MSDIAMSRGRRADRYRVTKPRSGARIALLAVGILVAVVVAGLVEGTLGFGNLVVVGLLVPAMMRWYLSSRTVISLDRSGVLVDGQSVRWHQVDEVALRSHSSDQIVVELRRRAGDAGASITRGGVPRSKSSVEELRAAFIRFGPHRIVINESDSENPATPGSTVGEVQHATDTDTDSGSGSGRAELVRRAERRRPGRDRHASTWERTWLNLLRWSGRHGNAAGSIAYVAVILLVVVGIVAAVSVTRDDPVVVEEGFAAFYPQDFFTVAGAAVEDGELVGPHFGLAIEHVAVADALENRTGRELPDQDERPGDFRAPGDHDLVVAVLDWDLLAADRVLRSSDDRDQLRIWIETGERTVEMDALPDPGGIAVVAVRDSEDALLVVEDAGREQSISLRTGRRQAAIDGYYRLADQDLDHRYEATGRAGTTIPLGGDADEGDVTVGLDLGSATRTPWDWDRGWAPSGRAWLRIMSSSPTGMLTSSADPGVGHLTLRALRAERVFSVVDETGEEIAALPAELGTTTSSVLFDVPDTFTRGILRITPATGTDFLWPDGLWVAPPSDDTVAIDLTTGDR